MSDNKKILAKMSCVFCNVNDDYLWLANDAALSFPDAHPLAEGHTLVVPRRHVASIYELSTSEQGEIWALVSQVREALLAEYQPDGFNIGVNDGIAAGQTVAHAHVHVIPRRHGDVPDPRGGIRWIIAENAPYWDAKG